MSPRRRVDSVRGLVVMLAIIALTTSLASRVVRITFDKVPAVHSLGSTVKIQHRDRDADERAFAAGDLSLLWVTETAATVEPAEPVYVRIHYDSLYNRPPPRS